MNYAKVLRIASGLVSVVALAAPVLALEPAGPEPGQRYRVSDVSRGDRLNVRGQAGTSADVIGSLPPDARDIVVTGAWQEIGSSVWWELVYPAAGNKTGWVNARFLALESAGSQGTPTTQSNYPLDCAGTEPFWSLAIDGDQARYSSPDALGEGAMPRILEASPWIDARGFASGYNFAVRLAEGRMNGFATIVRAQACSDGMSDINYPFHATLILSDDEVLGGCCTRAGR